MNFPEPARQVWREHADVLLKHLGYLSAETPDRMSWWIGGGTILAARWEHRQSFDIDILISSRLDQNATTEALRDIGTDLRQGGLDVELDTPNGWMHARYKDAETPDRSRGIDLWVKEPRLRRAREVERIETWRLPTLSTSQILYGKLLRDQQQTTRDAYDIGLSRTADPQGLESAVNSLSSERQRRSEILWAAGSPAMDRDERAIVAPDGRPANDQQGCGDRAARAVREARWTEVELTTRNNRLHARTRNAGGEVRDWLGPNGSPAAGCLRKLFETGIPVHILENYHDSDWKHRDVIEAIARGVQTTGEERILHARTATVTARYGKPEALMTAEIPGLRPEARGRKTTFVVQGQGLPAGGEDPGGGYSRHEGYKRS